MISSTVLTLAVVLAIYALIKEWPLRRLSAKATRQTATAGVASQIAPM